MTSKRYAWITDPHFGHLKFSELFNFFCSLRKFDGIFITGDISTGKLVEYHLKTLEALVRVPIYFVIGNHDLWYSDWDTVHKAISKINIKNDNLYYLSESDVISLSEDVALIGHDGWYDAHHSEPLSWVVFAPDWLFIKDFRDLPTNYHRLKKSREKAKEATNFVEHNLVKALKDHKVVYLLVHHPPWPQDSPSWRDLVNRFWNPYNSCKCMSDMLERVMKGHPDKKLIVLSGHTHLEKTKKISSNIFSKTGGARLGLSEIQDIIVID